MTFNFWLGVIGLFVGLLSFVVFIVASITRRWIDWIGPPEELINESNKIEKTNAKTAKRESH